MKRSKQKKQKLPSGLHGLLWKEGKWYVAKCVEVEVASQGKSKQAALANLSEAVALYFKGESVLKPPQFFGVELHTLRSSYA